jgi:hypothetical protein
MEGGKRRTCGLAGTLKNTALKRVLSTAETTPENVARLLFSAKPSDVRLLYDGLSPAGKTKAQSAIIQRAVEKAGGLDNVSPDRFATQIKNLGSQIGVFFSGRDLARVGGLGRVLSATQRASQAALAPPTGVQAVPYAMGAGFTTLFGLPGGISAAAGTGLLARAYESPPVRDLLLKLGRAKPGGSQEKMLLKRAAAAFNSALQKHVPEALNDNTLSSAAASPSDQQVTRAASSGPIRSFDLGEAPRRNRQRNRLFGPTIAPRTLSENQSYPNRSPILPAMQQVTNPYPGFVGLDGKPLALGKIYIGEENQDPETNPVTVYFDSGAGQTATQPIRTLAGYPDQNGSPAQLWVAGDIRSAFGTFSTSRCSTSPLLETMAGPITFTPSFLAILPPRRRSSRSMYSALPFRSRRISQARSGRMSGRTHRGLRLRSPRQRGFVRNADHQHAGGR